MIKAVLLDLDETLLHNPPSPFVVAYLGGFASVFSRHFPEIDTDTLMAGLMYSTDKVVKNSDPLKINMELFTQALAQQLQLSDTTLLKTSIDEFLDTDYGNLRGMTLPVPAAPKVVQWLHDHDYAIAIATNPLFPLEATRQRVEWAGIDLEALWLVTSMDNAHFAKPNPAYYEEILSRIGFEPDEALMVGDDWENDIVPAALAGINTFWVRPAATPAPSGIPTIQPSGTGTLADFLHLISEEDWLQTLSPLPVQAVQIRTRFLGNVAALHGTVEDVPDHYWHQRPDPNEWSPLEVLQHMLESECTVQRPRLQTILEEDNPFLPKPPEPPAPGSRDLSHVDPDATVQRFAEERLQTIALLTGLSDSQWGRRARHSVFGPTTLLEMAAFTARHDRLHINQLCQTIGKCQ